MASHATVRLASAAGAALFAFALLHPGEARAGKATTPVPSATLSLMAAKDVDPRAPILIRAFKKEAEMEVWKRNRAGRYVLLKTFPICRWSGQLGPKRRTGDRQTPEGFYAVPAGKMNPNSAYHLSFDVGYPNAYDRAHGGTGAFLMTHGTCSSMGCFAMTDAQITEIYALARDALAAGQHAFQFQSYPFRMTAQNMARARTEPHIEFWRQLKEGYDRFEAAGEELPVSVTAGRYTFPAYRNPAREEAAVAHVAEEKAKVEKLVADGAGAVRITYSDGGMHPAFAALWRRGGYVGQVSRPEALAMAGHEIVTIAARRKPPATVLAAAAKPKPPATPPADEMRPATTASLGAPRVPAAPSGDVQALFARAAYRADRVTVEARAMPGSAVILPAAFQASPPEKLASRGV
ncbi:murein L,D-transpeptidase family protein [Enterovirga sp.]|uniref:murein L,D-transpeptidase family protein n=1 Tax=Enterovirga sp. TaxID=2026350 RepID=UPI002C5FF90B|nr:murein L,D-transpeptidase family protein [Enterovirga sp.]HMO31236.1 murein L,D-transpeptidase family protein [Enterovirga sp.]